MKERPILFSGPMVRALLEGRKTQTRRVAKGVSAVHAVTGEALRDLDSAGPRVSCPYGAPGDRLWVRETWQGPMWEEGTWDADTDYHSPKYCEYRADGGPTPEYVDFEDNLHQGWKPSIHMPRWASRITLEITGVRVEQLQDISEADAESEGINFLRSVPDADETLNARGLFHSLWDGINGAGAWAANPWVWVVEFRRIQ